MGNEGFQAGSIFVQLRSQIEGLQKGVAQSKALLDSFGQSTQQAAAKVGQAGEGVNRSFNRMQASAATAGKRIQDNMRRSAESVEDMERRTSRAQARFARALSRIFAIESLLSPLIKATEGLGTLGTAMDSAGRGISFFATIAATATTKTARFFGAIAGGGIAALDFFSTKMREAIKETDRQTILTQEATRSVEAYGKALENAGRFAKAFNLTEAERLAQEVEIQRSAFAAIQGRVAELAARGEALKHISGTAVNETDRKAAAAELNTVNFELDNLLKRLGDIEKAFPRSFRAQQLAEANKQVTDLKNGLEDLKRIADTQVALGLIDPTDRLRGGVGARAQVLAQLQQRRAALDRIQPGLGNQVGTEISQQMNELKKGIAALRESQEIQQLAGGFSSAVGQGIRDGILSGASAMETLAGIGRNLFSNMVDNFVQKLETNLSEAFRAVFNEAGGPLANLFTGLLGVAGFFLSKRGQKGSQSFGSIQSGVESSQAVRGIVAGPASVSIAALGEDLARVMVPVQEILRLQLDVQKVIARNTAGGAAPGGLGYVGVATP